MAMIPTLKQKIWFGMALVFLCVLVSGCQSMIDSEFDDLSHHDDVKYYENRGVSHQDAERAVYEDNYFRHMDEAAGSNP
jgi:hypothetical protein